MNLFASALQAAPPPAGAPAPVSPVTHPDAGAAPSGGPGIGLMFVMIFGFMALMWWQSRSQQKKQAAAIAGLKRGDRVATQSGLVGRLVDKDERYAKLEIAPGVKVQVLANSLVGRDAEPPTAGGKEAASKDKEEAK